VTIGATWYGLFPRFSRAAPATLGASPLRSLLAGLVVVIGTPLAGAGFAAILIGLPIAVLLALLYPVALILGLVTGTFWLGDAAVFRLRGLATTGQRLLALLAVAVTLALVSLVPIVGPIVLWAGTILGTGAFWLRLLRADAGGQTS